MNTCNTFKTWFQFAAMGLCILLLAACQTKPAGLTPEQIAVLQKKRLLTDSRRLGTRAGCQSAVWQ